MTRQLHSPSRQPVAEPVSVSVTGLGKRFAGVTALDDVTIQFPSGKVTAVMGENEAGKSTLMTILAGLQPPDHGTVAIAGRDGPDLQPT